MGVIGSWPRRMARTAPRHRDLYRRHPRIYRVLQPQHEPAADSRNFLLRRRHFVPAVRVLPRPKRDSGVCRLFCPKKINSQEALSDIKPPGDNNGQEKGEAS